MGGESVLSCGERSVSGAIRVLMYLLTYPNSPLCLECGELDQRHVVRSRTRDNL